MHKKRTCGGPYVITDSRALNATILARIVDTFPGDSSLAESTDVRCPNFCKPLSGYMPGASLHTTAELSRLVGNSKARVNKSSYTSKVTRFTRVTNLGVTHPHYDSSQICYPGTAHH